MNKNFATLLGEEFNWTFTENGQIARSSTGSSLLDLYGTVGALRTRPGDVIDMFASAFAEDRLLATKLSFYARNIRGGLGERTVSRFMWRWLAINVPEIMKKNMHLVPVFGRWDDLYMFIDTPIENEMWGFISTQLVEDIKTIRTKGKSPSLLAKWLKSVNSSSLKTRALGRYTANKLGFSERDYRRILSNIRGALGNAVVEKKMSANNWNEIDFEKVCSKAMTNSRKAFSKHDGERFVKYLEAVKKGDAVIHSATLYPYDILEKAGLSAGYYTDGRRGYYSGRHDVYGLASWDETLEAQWNALPNYVENGENVLIVADTSGSMQGRPVCTSIGLGIYFAEHNKGQFHNQFMTFSSTPHFITLKGATLKDKVACVDHDDSNTNLEAVFELLLDVAVKNKVSQEDMPAKIVVISDMEIDSVQNGYSFMSRNSRSTSRKVDFTTELKTRFAHAGYELPDMVYWNVDSRNGNVFHATKDEHGIQLASGQSPSVFKGILNAVGVTAYDAMLEVLNSEEYSAVTI
jgi:hypothetical protein